MENPSISTIEGVIVPETIDENKPFSAGRHSRRPTNFQKFKKACLPTKRKLYMSVSQILILILISGTMWGILKQQNLPIVKIFGLILLGFTSVVFGKLCRLMKLPPLSGMIVAGFMFRNIGFLSYEDDFSHKSSAILRNISLVIILLRAGLGLCPDTLKKMKMLLFQLSFVACCFEAFVSAVCTHFFLALPWIWSLMLGFLLCAVSPAIIVPCFLRLMDKRYGINKGIPTLSIAVASIDDIIAVTGFGIFFGIAFSKGSFVWMIVKGPVEVLVGIAYGAVLGVVGWYIPHIENVKQIYYRVLLLVFGGLAVMFVSLALEFSGAGALGCLTLAFVAALDWRHNEEQFPTICMSVAVMWHFFQPLLFSLIGREIDLNTIKDDAGWAILAIVIGIVTRMLFTPFISCGGNFNTKEKIFIAIANLPKATVQAALGSVALDQTRLNSMGPEYVKNSIKVLTVAVLSILLTAPIGAALINITGPRLLDQSTEPEADFMDEGVTSSYTKMSDKIRSQISINTL